MDESLRRWCVESREIARERFSALIPALNRQASGHYAELAVNAAAFRRFVDARDLPCRVATKQMFAGEAFLPYGMESLAQSCPLDRTTSPDVLGAIHELLVTLREASATVAGRHSSRSRKSNGIFYSPDYIVDEIVRKTVGPLLKHPRGSQQDPIRILDPAAGCGAFLVGTLRFLIRSRTESLIEHSSNRNLTDAPQMSNGWKPTFQECRKILTEQLYGVDLDPSAIDVMRRILLLTLVDCSAEETIPTSISGLDDELAGNFKAGNALLGSPFPSGTVKIETECLASSASGLFDWNIEFPHVSKSGGFDAVVGNPPYRRERDFKRELDEISATPLGQRFRTARMDLWYYFFHRGIQLLKQGGRLSFITNAYWIHGLGAEKLISSLREDVHLEELFLLRNQPVFPGVSGNHVILRVAKSTSDEATKITEVSRTLARSARSFLAGDGKVRSFKKSKDQLFRDGRLDVKPAADDLLERIGSQPRLDLLGIVRQGIAENPASINRRTLERYGGHPASADWRLGEGVFSLGASDVSRIALPLHERELLRPYHHLSDLERYWFAPHPSQQLIYSTRKTCPDISMYPTMGAHLSRFRPILEARRETQKGTNCWWHLHWPRDEMIWQADKIVAIQMAVRPSFVPIFGPSYVSFSTNVFVPAADTREDLRFFSGVLNSKTLWAWFTHHAKQRGIGLELNGIVLGKAPIRRIQFDCPDDVRQHDQLVAFVDRRMQLASLQRAKGVTKEKDPDPDAQRLSREIIEIERQMDHLVASLYGLNPGEIELVDAITVDSDW